MLYLIQLIIKERVQNITNTNSIFSIFGWGRPFLAWIMVWTKGIELIDKLSRHSLLTPAYSTNWKYGKFQLTRWLYGKISQTVTIWTFFFLVTGMKIFHTCHHIKISYQNGDWYEYYSFGYISYGDLFILIWKWILFSDGDMFRRWHQWF